MLCLFSALALSVLAVAAATQPSGTLIGRVLDETGMGLPGVNVHLHHAQGELTTFTDDAGGYRFEGLPPGRVELTFRLINFTLVKREMLINGGRSTARRIPCCASR